MQRDRSVRLKTHEVRLLERSVRRRVVVGNDDVHHRPSVRLRYRSTMARVEYPNLDAPEAQQMVAQVRKERGGRFLNLFHMQLYNPAILDGWLRLSTAVRFKSELDSPTRELAICLVAKTTASEYEWRGHRRIALEEGFSETQLDGILDWRSGQFDDRQLAVLALAEGLT